MEHTWLSYHLPKLEVSNLDSGDVAVCGSFAKHAPILPHVDADRVAFVAPLTSRSDLEWLLRGLDRHPNVRNLVLCGDDPRGTGDSLLALWRDGVDEGGRLRGSRGRLSADLAAATVDALRRDVVVWDWRERPPTQLAGGTRKLPIQTGKRESCSLADPVTPERKVFLSRKTSFPIFASDVADSWLQLLNLTLRIGTEKRTADGECLAQALNAIVTIGLPVIAEDLEVENVGKPEDFPAFLDFDRQDFERYYRRFEAVGERLKRSADTSAGAVAFLGPDDLDPEIAPQLISATFNTSGQELFGSFVLRCADVYTDWPIQAMALGRLQRELADHLGLELGAATFVVHSAQLYERDWDRSLRIVAESFKRPLPLQVDHSGIFLFGNDGGEARAMLLDHDAGTIFWEDAFASPVELSWYIVDAMPWLLPQHIRYVGQECASLMRAMQEGECYEQG
jgi:hypothetical protein